MTAIWGPMGWMTLHSISLLYPEQATVNDKQILKTFMSAFIESMTCQHCQQHFRVIFENYIRAHPEWSNSRFDLFLFIARAHNTVNKRLEKPLKTTVQECLDSIITASQYTPLSQFRKKYIDYVVQRMAAEMSGDSMVKAGYGRELRRINDTYWNSKIATDTSTFDMNANVLEFINENSSSMRLMLGGSNNVSSVMSTDYIPKIGFRGGRLRLNAR